MEDIIKLNVSGKRYEITKTTSLKIPYFATMLADCNDKKEIFVERSSMTFDHVLAYVIDNKYPFPLKYCYELYFYGISYDKFDVYRIIISDKQYELKLDILDKIPYLKTIIVSNAKDNSIPIYLKRSSILFDHVLSYVLNPRYKYPIEYHKELQFYGIIYDKNKLYDDDKLLCDNNRIIQDHLYIIENRIINEHNNHNSIACLFKGSWKNCSNYVFNERFCKEHINELGCYVRNCKEKILDSNFCAEHSDYICGYCHFKNCAGKSIVDKKFCYLHDE